MLKREEYKEVSEGIKIKIPNAKESEKLINQLNKKCKADDGEIDYDNPTAIYTLFKKLVVSDIKEIKNLTEVEFLEAYENPSDVMETICFEIGRIISNTIMSVMRKNLAQLMETEMKLMQAQALNKLNEINRTTKEIENNKK